MAKSASKPLNIFIGCPGDMAAERDALLASRDHIESVVCPVKFRTWKMSASGVGDAQRVIFENDSVESFDIVIILLWSRLGVPSGVFDPVTATEMTGTEVEFVAAYDLHQSRGKKRPQVLLYRCSRKAEIDTNSPTLAEDMAQLQAVQRFFKQTENGGLRPMLAQSFKTAEELTKIVERDIKTAAGRLHDAAKKPSAPDRKPSPKPKPANSGELLHRYFANLRDQFAIYENLGLPVPERDGQEGEKDAPIPIRRLFVAPACTDAQFRPEAFDAALREGKHPVTPLLPRLAPAKSRTVLLADPGMGKSTLIQWLIATLAEEAVPLEQAELRGAIPLPFILRDLVGHLPQEVKGWNWDALVDAFRQWRHRGKGAPLAAPLTADEAFFRSILASPDAFFLIDGLDEIGDPQRRLAIRDAIWQGFEKYPNARWLITSRIVGYQQASVDRFTVLFEVRGNREEQHAEVKKRIAPYIGKGFGAQWVTRPATTRSADAFADTTIHFARLLHLAPFDNTQQLTFARNWYVPRLGDAAGAQRADDFVAAVHRNDHTRVISRVPNLLYLLALLFRHRARLPDGRALVYAAISSAYLADIDLGRHLPDSLSVPWKFEEKEDLLALVAMRMQELRVAQAKDAEDTMSETDRMLKKVRGDAKDARGEILVTRAQLEEWLGPRFGGAGDAGACAELHRFLDHIANRSGLLLPRGEGMFGFAHLSFQEYYAACFLEKEFRRILNEKAQTSGGDIFDTPAAAGKKPKKRKKDEAKRFAIMAEQPAWHEPLLFLVEKLRHSPPDTLTVLRWAFPQLATEPKRGKDWMPFTAAQFLVGISLDQEVSLDAAQRENLWIIVWHAHLAQQWESIWRKSDWHISPSLLAASAYQTEVLQVLTALQPERLFLTDCTAVSDLKPLSGLASLQGLDLDGCTAVRDLKPLSGLASLQSLYLTDCTAVSDLKPLSGLSSLQWLSLRGCTAVNDLKPLSGLASLQCLLLSGCAAVRDLKPLSGLGSLQLLLLDGCIAVSDEAVAALQVSLPKLEIHR